MKGRRLIEHLAPWLGLVGGAAGWVLSHQLGSNAAFDDCRAASPLFVLLVCLFGLLLCAGGGLYSLDVHRRETESEGRRFIGLLGAALAALAAFAVVLQAVSSLILPRCLA